MLLITLFLTLCALSTAIPQSPPPIPIPTIFPRIPPYTPETCPAFTPITQTYITTITTTTLVSRHCPSFTTRVDEPAPWSSCAFKTAECIRPACLQISTITHPCITDNCCTRTARETVYKECAKKCPTGCATSWTVASNCAGS
ncbi:hypothetical protein P153DRAFT_385763 [Dothidotthia symphoricarpi CBS 119687]|uniref:Extracellular membrane protein CFEM domain-containing protein n=1 Tax=Dothidotthia symphoricarpi CBS 119687 TaxID=1392245 RepID=A0A6A6AEM2_9PLEO|nr:uncharacterized protein P153DRAFT_385763 [Dothidotthia symphoricarpi CBS 119687]KAF2129555.1 hypothetical protein P153DRAFT_385763 [Dothidotthia symphoricarpi CBS 119687]